MSGGAGAIRKLQRNGAWVDAKKLLARSILGSKGADLVRHVAQGVLALQGIFQVGSQLCFCLG